MWRGSDLISLLCVSALASRVTPLNHRTHNEQITGLLANCGQACAAIHAIIAMACVLCCFISRPHSNHCDHRVKSDIPYRTFFK